MFYILAEINPLIKYQFIECRIIFKTCLNAALLPMLPALISELSGTNTLIKKRSLFNDLRSSKGE